MNKKRLILNFCTVVALVFAVLFGIGAKPVRAQTADGIVSWGLRPNTNEKTPEPPADGAKMLEEFNGLFVKKTAQKKVYFSFDLGYEAGFTGQVLDILKENDIKAVFFLCSPYLKQKDLIDRMIEEGHEIGNHTDKHKDLPKLSEEGIKKDISDFQEKFKAAYNTPLRFFRPPQGRFDRRVLKIAADYQLRAMLWSIAIQDWGKEPFAAQPAAEKIASRLHPGAVILCHITNAATPKMLKLLLPLISEKGYTVGAPNEL